MSKQEQLDKTEKETKYQEELINSCKNGTYLYFIKDNILVEYIKYVEENNEHIVYVIDENKEKIKDIIHIKPFAKIVIGLEVIESYLKARIDENIKKINNITNGGDFLDYNIFRVECYDKQIKEANEYIKNNPNNTTSMEYKEYSKIIKMFPKKKDFYKNRHEENRDNVIKELTNETNNLQNKYNLVLEIINGRKTLNGN